MAMGARHEFRAPIHWISFNSERGDMSIDNKTPLRAFDVRNTESRGALLLVRGMDAFELGELEAYIWRLCDGENTIEQIGKKVESDFAVTAEVATADAREFLLDLHRNGLIEW
jgi:hypothetical protein